MTNIEHNISLEGMNFIVEPMHGLSKCSTLERLMQHSMRYQLFYDMRENQEKSLYYPDVMQPQLVIDYTQEIEDPMNSFALDRPFSWIDWRHAELVC